MLDDIPAPLFLVVGLGMAVFSTFVALKTDFMRFIFFFITSAVFIAIGLVKIILAEPKKGTPLPPIMPSSREPIGPQYSRPETSMERPSMMNAPPAYRQNQMRPQQFAPPQQPVQQQRPPPRPGNKFNVDRYGPPINRR